MKLSICILAGTDGTALAGCLEALARQRLPVMHETLVAAPPGAGGTPDLPPLTVMLPPVRGIVAALRLAAATAKGDLIAVIDPRLSLTDPGKLAAQVAWLEGQPLAAACIHPVADGLVAEPDGVVPVQVGPDDLMASRAPVEPGTFVLRRTFLNSLPAWVDAAADPGWALAVAAARSGGLWRLPRAMATGPAGAARAQADLALALQRAGVEREVILSERAALRADVARLRRRPWRGVLDLAAFRLLSVLARATPPLPARMAARMATSAAKRDPGRSLPGDPAARPSAPAAIRSGATRHAGRPADPARESILVVTHEASRTGAPILALNLCQALAGRYNVVAMALRDGDLRPDFEGCATEVLVADRYHRDGSAYADLIGSTARRLGLRYAIVNSLESVAVLAPLRRAGVPAVSLIHEFATYTMPKSIIPEVVAGSDDTVFSSDLTLEDAVALTAMPEGARLHVVPQGKSAVPAGAAADPGARQAELDWLRAALRPTGDDPARFVVLGAGSVHIRKGLDLFLDSAARLASGPGGGRYRFVWIGQGYAPDTDMAYSAYLADQIRRSGLGRQVAILRQTAEIEAAYRLADVFLLSSRLDPLPNVAIDALTAGLPVLCFDRTTGIAAHLTDAGLGRDLVVPYLDTAALAAAIARLAGDPAGLARLRDLCRQAALGRFDMARYVDRIDAIALAAAARRAARA